MKITLNIQLYNFILFKWALFDDLGYFQISFQMSKSSNNLLFNHQIAFLEYFSLDTVS